MIGEAQHRAVAPRHPPAMAGRGGVARKMRGKPRRYRPHGRISVSGMAGMRPAEMVEIDVNAVRVEAHRNVELEACAYHRTGRRHVAVHEGHRAGHGIHRMACRRLRHAVDRDQHRPLDGLCDPPRPAGRRIAIPLREPEGRARAVAGADLLVGGRDRLAWRTGFPVQRIAEAEAVQPAAPRLEEFQHRIEIGRRPDAGTRVVAPPRIPPAGIPVLPPVRQVDDIGPAHRAAARSQRKAQRKADLMESRHG